MPVISGSGGGGSAGTETLIATQTAGAGGVASFDFTSIAGSYNDLRLLVIARSTRGAASDPMKMTFNADTTGGNYNTEWLGCVPAGAASAIDSTTGAIQNGVLPGASATAGLFGGFVVWIPGYANANRNKIAIFTEIVGFTSSGNSNQQMPMGWWLSSAAITRVTVAPVTGPNWAQFSEARLYGIT